MIRNRRFARSRTDRVIAGVCGGLGNYFGISATMVRVLFVLFLVLPGSSLLAYAILWIVMPLERQMHMPEEEPREVGRSYDRFS